MATRDQECVEFLQWALPRMGLRWRGFRKVRRQVCRRVRQRIGELGLECYEDYKAQLEQHPDEWARLDGFCRIPISRFFRDRSLFDRLRQEFQFRRERTLRCWSAGCAAGEEPWSLAILARHALPGVTLDILATDSAPHQLERARTGIYRASSLREVPDNWREEAFEREHDEFVLRPDHRAGVQFALGDIRHEMPDGPFDLILCRYLAFTYFDAALQRKTLDRLVKRLAPDGLLAIGRHETLPEPETLLEPLDRSRVLYARSCQTRT